MAIAINTLQPGDFGILLNADSADVTACETIRGTPGAGKRIVIDFIRINSGAAISIEIGEGAGVGVIDTALIGPVLFAVGLTLAWNFTYRDGMVLTANNLLLIDASGAGQVNVFVCGRIL